MELGPEAFPAQVARVGAATAGQSVRLVPADKKLYRLRDLTATVESVPLIASSVMSKKIAAGADVIVLAGSGREEARAALRETLDNGRALGVFRELVVAQGGDTRVIDDPALLPRSPQVAFLTAPGGGFVAGLDALLVADAAMEAGASLKDGAVLDPGAGVILHRKVGDLVAARETLAEVHLARGVEAQRPLELLAQAYSIGGEMPALPPLVLDRVTER